MTLKIMNKSDSDPEHQGDVLCIVKNNSNIQGHTRALLDVDTDVSKTITQIRIWQHEKTGLTYFLSACLDKNNKAKATVKNNPGSCIQ